MEIYIFPLSAINIFVACRSVVSFVSSSCWGGGGGRPGLAGQHSMMATCISTYMVDMDMPCHCRGESDGIFKDALREFVRRHIHSPPSDWWVRTEMAKEEDDAGRFGSREVFRYTPTNWLYTLLNELKANQRKKKRILFYISRRMCRRRWISLAFFLLFFIKKGKDENINCFVNRSFRPLRVLLCGPGFRATSIRSSIP